MSSHLPQSLPVWGHRAAARCRHVARALAHWIGHRAELRRQRLALGRLDDRLLQDIGLGREIAAREAARRSAWPF